MAAKAAHAIVRDAVEAIRAGRRYEVGAKYRDITRAPTFAIGAVHRTQVLSRMGYAMAYYRRAGKPETLRAVQILWPDPSGYIPPDRACDPEIARLQPILDVPVPAEELRAMLARYGSVS